VAFASGEDIGGGCQAQTSQVTSKAHGDKPVIVNMTDTDVVCHVIPNNSIQDNARSRVELIRCRSLPPQSRALMITHRLGLGRQATSVYHCEEPSTHSGECWETWQSHWR
jgi:hypothetical protein